MRFGFIALLIVVILVAGCTSNLLFKNNSTASSGSSNSPSENNAEQQSNSRDNTNNQNNNDASNNNGNSDNNPGNPSAEDLKVEAQNMVDQALATDAPLEELLKALETAQLNGIEDENGNSDRLLKKIKIKIEMQLVDPGLCKKKLLDIAALAQQFGFDDIANIASNRVSKALDSCGGESGISTAESVYYSKGDDDSGIPTTIKASVKGKLKESTVLGFSSSGQDTFYFSDATLTWSYNSAYTDGCEMITKIGSGTEKLSSSSDGSFTLFSDGSYNGELIAKKVKLTITVQKNPASTPKPVAAGEEPPVDKCAYVQTKSSEEEYQVELYVDGTGSNMKFLTGSKSENFVTTNWNLKIPE